MIISIIYESTPQSMNYQCIVYRVEYTSPIGYITHFCTPPPPPLQATLVAIVHSYQQWPIKWGKSQSINENSIQRYRHITVIKEPQGSRMITLTNFPSYLPFVREIHRSPADSPDKGQGRGASMLSLICWTNTWANHEDAGNLRRRRDHYDVTVMRPPCPLLDKVCRMLHNMSHVDSGLKRFIQQKYTMIYEGDSIIYGTISIKAINHAGETTDKFSTLTTLEVAKTRTSSTTRDENSSEWNYQYISNYCLQNGGHFVPVSICIYIIIFLCVFHLATAKRQPYM